MRADWIFFVAVCLGLFIITVATYWPVVSCEFVTLDDPDYVYQNRNVLAGLSWVGWEYAWSSFACSNWHPLTWLSLELDQSLWGRNSAGFHATNLFFHTANVLLLFVVLCRMTDCLVRSAWVAAFFAVHPLHVESVAWVSERKDVLSTFFLLLSIWAYVGYAARPTALRYMAVFGLMALGLLAKPMLVTLPLLLLLLDGWPLNRIARSSDLAKNVRFPRSSLRWLFVEKIPLLILAFADGLMTIFAQRDATRVLELTLTARCANMFHAYLWYLQKTFTPSKLIVFYPHPEGNLPWNLVGTGVLVVIGFSVLAVSFRHNKPHLTVGWFWFLISLLPVIGILQVGGQAFADRYTYVPHIGLFLGIIWETAAWLSSTRTTRVIGNLVLTAALAICLSLTQTQIGYWKNNDTLWSHVLEIDPDNPVAHQHLADVRFYGGDFELTITHIERLLQLKRPDSRSKLSKIYLVWGKCLVGLKRSDDAEEKFRDSLRYDPDQETALTEMIRLLEEDGRRDDAAPFSARLAGIQREKQLVAQAMQNPYTESAQLILGQHRARQGNLGQAISHFENAIQISPHSATAYNSLAVAQAQQHRLSEAKSNFVRSIELNPKLAVAHFGLAQILEVEKDFSGARKHFAEAFQLNPLDTEAKQNLDRLSNP